MEREAGMYGGGRSMLFVPGDRPERFERAAAAGADQVVIDLEDAVDPKRRPEARTAARAWLAGGGHAWVRVNNTSSADIKADLAAVADTADGVMLPKATLAGVRKLKAILVDHGTYPLSIIALIESALGVEDSEAIAREECVVALAFGHLDLASELGVDPEDSGALAYARSRLVIAAAAADLPAPFDGVTTKVHDLEATRMDVLHARHLGFGGKLCIHPAQVPVTHEALRPTPTEIEWAETIVREAGQGVQLLDSELVDAPVVARARTILKRTTGSIRGSRGR